jgi:hypothetical protein
MRVRQTRRKAGQAVEALRENEVLAWQPDVDPEARELWNLTEERRTAATGIVRRLSERKALLHDLDHQSASDILWVLNDPALYQLLVTTPLDTTPLLHMAHHHHANPTPPTSQSLSRQMSRLAKPPVVGCGLCSPGQSRAQRPVMRRSRSNIVETMRQARALCS